MVREILAQTGRIDAYPRCHVLFGATSDHQTGRLGHLEAGLREQVLAVQLVVYPSRVNIA